MAIPDDPLTSLILPTYDPGAEVETTWRKLDRFLDEAPGRWEIVFVSDGCTDDTPRNLMQLASGRSSRVQVIHYPVNRGKGYAVYRGLASARGRWRIFTDFDLAYGLDDILAVARRLWAGEQAVIASRMHPQSRVDHPVHLQSYVFRRHLQSRLFSFLVRRLLPLTCPDTQAGLKGFHADLLERILPLLRCDGFEFDCELLTACVWSGESITEVPVTVRYDSASSTTSLANSRRMIAGLFRIWRSWRSWPNTTAPVLTLPQVVPMSKAA